MATVEAQNGKVGVNVSGDRPGEIFIFIIDQCPIGKYLESELLYLNYDQLKNLIITLVTASHEAYKEVILQATAVTIQDAEPLGSDW